MKLWQWFFLACLPISAQQLVRVDPDCPVNGLGYVLTGAATTSAVIDNRQSGCSNWTFTYTQVTAGALQVELQSAPDNNGVPGTWVTFATGTVTVGANPSTVTPAGIVTLAAAYQPWVRVLSDSQSANIIGFVFGSRSAAGAGSGPPPTGGCVGTVGIPCVVDGPNAAGAASTKPPVQVAGNDGTNVRAIATDTAGDTVGVGPDAVGAVPTKNPVQIGGYDGTDVRRIETDSLGELMNVPRAGAYPLGVPDGQTNSPVVPLSGGIAPAVINQVGYPNVFNGSTWDRQFYGSAQARINVSAGTGQRLIPLVMGATTKLTHLDFAMNAATNVTIVQGTTVSTPCDTGATILAGPYENVAVLALDWSPLSPLKDLAASQDTCVLFSGTVTGGGVAMYAQY